MEVVKITGTHTDYVPLFKALADETRLRIIDMLSFDELCACHLLEHFPITQPTLSYHLKILCDSGLVNSRREGSWMRYSLNREQFETVRELFENLVRR